MQFDKDLISIHAELFLEIRDLLKDCIGEDVKEKYSENITSLHSKEGGFCYLRTYDTYVHIGWFRGSHIEDTHGFLFGNGKTIRGQKIQKLDEKTKESIKYYVQETLYFLIEHNEIVKMKRKRR